MPRTVRIVIPGLPYHLTHHGVSDQQVFLDDEDCTAYLALLKHYSTMYGLQVLAYCLMPTHLHLAGIPTTATTLADTLSLAQSGYTKHFNRRYHRRGSLWYERYYACPLEGAHLLNALRYIERNPVRAGLVNHAWEYPWSSATAHVTGLDPTGILDMDWWYRHFDGDSWREELHHPEDTTWQEQLRASTRSGRPFGSDAFVTHLEQLTGRPLHAPPHGRPKKHRPPDPR